MPIFVFLAKSIGHFSFSVVEQWLFLVHHFELLLLLVVAQKLLFFGQNALAKGIFGYYV